jgi:hypothetical protein
MQIGPAGIRTALRAAALLDGAALPVAVTLAYRYAASKSIRGSFSPFRCIVQILEIENSTRVEPEGKVMAKRPKFEVDTASTPWIIRCVLSGVLQPEDVRAFVVAHNAAVDAQRGADYKVWVDLRAMEPLSPEATEVMEQAKRYSSRHPNFRGSAVLVSRATILLQHRRTSVSTGVIDSELLSDDEAECRRHLATVYRTAHTLRAAKL